MRITGTTRDDHWLIDDRYASALYVVPLTDAASEHAKAHADKMTRRHGPDGFWMDAANVAAMVRSGPG